VANLRRIPYTKPVPAGAEVVTRKGERVARFKGRGGKTVQAPRTEDGTRIRMLSRKWYGEYRDADGVERRVPLATDRTAAELMLAELVRKAELKQANVADPFEEHSKRPLAEHLADFRRELEARGNAHRSTDLVVSRLEDLLAGCGFVFTRDLSASRVMDWLAGLRRRGGARAPLEPGKEWWTRNEAAHLLGIKPASVPPLVRRHRLQAAGKGRKRRYPRTARSSPTSTPCAIPT
jgi:hypothetical protein